MLLAVFATAITGLLYFSYFQLAPWIWSKGVPVNPADITPWVVPWIDERDGIELYVLYAFMFLNLALALLLNYGWSRLGNGAVRYLFVAPFLLASVFLLYAGLHPPMSGLHELAWTTIINRALLVLFVILPIVILMSWLQRFSAGLSLLVAALLLIPVCFVATAPIDWYDYSFVLAPAVRLLHGDGIAGIYFQYDLLLSLAGWLWMKLGLDLNAFQMVGQFSFLLMLLGMFVVARNWFLDKRLPVYLLVALVLVRMYASPGDVVHSFQLTPFRLDLWLVLLALVHYRGVRHWSVGLCCAALLVLHRNFGLIYAAAYIQLLFTLCVIEAESVPGPLVEKARSAVRGFFIGHRLNLIMIAMGLLGQYLLFRNPEVQGDEGIVSLGIGFIRISPHSFYWYVVAMHGLTFILLIRLRKQISRNYLTAGFCLLYLAIGNSLYFFGRSHENNIINIAAVLLLLFFLLLDLAGRFLGNDMEKPGRSFLYRNFPVIVSSALLVSIAVWYGNTIDSKAAIQAGNLANRQFIQPSDVPMSDITATLVQVRSVTGDDRKVYFVGDNDMLFDYYGGYAPVGYYDPVYAWISRPAFVRFLQNLIDKGYYLVVDNGVTDMLQGIRFSNYRSIQGRVVAWK